MPNFQFIAKDKMGNNVQGNLQAPTLLQAANQIGQLGYELVDLKPAPQTVEPTQTFPQPTQQLPEPTQVVSIPQPSNVLDNPEQRRKAEQDLARLGMKPDEIKRLLNARADISLPTSTPQRPPVSLPLPETSKPKKVKATQKRADAAASLEAFAAQLAATNASKRTQEIQEVKLDLPEFRISTPQEQIQAESLIREAMMLRRKNNYPEARAKCRAALDLIPKDASTLELYGDILQGLAQIPEALAAYKRATEADPKRTAAERKYADLRLQQEYIPTIDPEEVPPNPVASTILSILFPGAGQLHNREFAKASAFLSLAGLCVLFWFVLKPNAEGSTSSNNKQINPVSTPVNSKTPQNPVKTNTTGKGNTISTKKNTEMKLQLELPTIISRILYVILILVSATDANIIARKLRNAGK